MKKQVKTLFLLSYDSTRRRRYYTFTSVCIIFEYFVLIARKYDKQHRLSVGSGLKVCYTCYNMYHRIREIRSTKPMFAMDFQNDGEYVGGCIAGGRRYFHINANGDADPCVFIHYSDSNIREKSLLEILRSPLFMAYHDGQPFNENHLRPCPMLENPEKLRGIVRETGARSTDMQSPESADHLCDKCVAYAENWAPCAEKLWSCHCSGCNKK